MTAQKEIHETVKLCNFCTRMLGISFIDELPNTLIDILKTNVWFVFSASAILTLVAGEFVYVTGLLIGSPSLAEFVASLHIIGYGCISINKLLTIYVKRDVFRHLLSDLEKIWPVNINDQEAVIKRESLRGLRIGQICYTFTNVLGVTMYGLTPIALHLYRISRGEPSDLGFMWRATYPVDKSKPIYHEFVYLFEAFAGSVSVRSMLGTDMLFTTMASHISMLLRILQVKIRSLAISNSDADQSSGQEKLCDCYEDIISVIQIHQRLISYSKDLEDAFSMVNLINVLLSSVNICCVMFNIVLLEPWMDVSNKFYLVAAMIQVGMICWYADDIYRSSVGVSDAVYESGWYKTNMRCRRTLLLMLQRSQKPLYFTALNFHNITMATYRSILTSAYSYFALLYTVYRN